MRHVLLTLAFGAATSTFGATLFTETFESASGLGDGNWATAGTAVIVANPMVDVNNPSANVVHFGGLGSGGDLFSKFISYSGDPDFIASGQLLLSFDFLWTNTSAVSWAGTDHVTCTCPGDEQWLWNSAGGALYGTTPPANTWVHVAFRFKPEDSGNVGSIVLKFEQGSGTAGTSYFDNIRLAAVPEPSSLALLSLGISGLAIRLYSRRSKLNRAGRRD
jgi:hypothetical protein